MANADCSVTTTVAVHNTVFTTEEEKALVGFLAGYRGLTFEAYQLDLRQWVQCCAERKVAYFGARRAGIKVRSAPRSVRASPRDGRTPVVHDRRLLPLARGSRPPTPTRLRITRNRP